MSDPQASFFDSLDAWGASFDQPFNTERQAGVDEVGIGPLAGPVVAAAVLLDPNRPIDGLADSKAISAKKREEMASVVRECAAAWSISFASIAEIDQMNILQASHLAMQRAVQSLRLEPQMIFVDGNKTPRFSVPCVAVVKGDQRIPQISAASILAKVARDEVMADLAQQFPGYGFERHMGYPTRAHFEALQQLGPTPVHRRSFAPVQAALAAHPQIAAATVEPQQLYLAELSQSGGWMC